MNPILLPIELLCLKLSNACLQLTERLKPSKAFKILLVVSERLLTVKMPLLEPEVTTQVTKLVILQVKIAANWS